MERNTEVSSAITPLAKKQMLLACWYMLSTVHMKTYPRNCAVCESAEKRTTFRQPLVVPVGRCTYAGYDVVTCSRCGFIYADTGMLQDALDQHYAGPTKVAQSLTEDGEAEGDLPRLDNTLKALMPLAKPGDRIFDVGCGAGRLLGLLKQNGFPQVSGIDQSPAAAEIARTKYDVPVIVGSIFDYQEHEFDLVTTCHVLEHIKDLSAFLLCLRGLIGESGVLYVEVPNASDFSRFADPDAPQEWIYIRDLYTHFTPEHVNFFSPTSLRNLMTRFGFEKVFCNADTLGVITSAWRRRPILVDTHTESEVALYAQKSEELQADALRIIQQWAISGREILVWGAGLHTQRLLSSSDLGKANIMAFVDGDPSYQGGELAARPIIAPGEIGSIANQPPILISSWKSQGAIVQATKNRRIPNELILLYKNR